MTQTTGPTNTSLNWSSVSGPIPATPTGGFWTGGSSYNSFETEYDEVMETPIEFNMEAYVKLQEALIYAKKRLNHGIKTKGINSQPHITVLMTGKWMAWNICWKVNLPGWHRKASII